MTKPNFFIVGAPKAGTTAMHQYLQGHPNIYMSEIKEPKYFCEDFPRIRYVRSEDQYLNLFKGATPEHLIVGESSTLYLSSAVALQNIYRFNPEAKILVMLRNPVDMVYSLHSELLFQAIETEPDFETAWRLQDKRSQGLDLPPGCLEPAYLQYRTIAQIGTQVEQLLQIFPKAQIKFILFEDFTRSTQTAYEQVVTFLGLSSDGRINFDQIRENRARRFNALSNALRDLRLAYRSSLLPVMFKSSLFMPIRVKLTRFVQRLDKLNSVRLKRQQLAPSLRQELLYQFKDEIVKVQQILNCDLSHWLS